MLRTNTIEYQHPAPQGVVSLRNVRTREVYPLDPSKPVLTIGRARICDITLADPTVSMTHCELIRTADGTYTIAEASSRNGMYLNHVRTTRAVLSPGMWIYLGITELVALGRDGKIPITATRNLSFLAKGAIYYGSAGRAAAHVDKSPATIGRALKCFREEIE